MKRISISLLAIALSAATVNAQISYGVQGSFIGSNLDIKRTDPGVIGYGNITQMRASYRGGLVVNIPVGEKFALMPQLNYLSGGTRLDGTTSIVLEGVNIKLGVKGNMRPNFLELPVNFVFTKSLSTGGRFFAGAGPSIAMGLGGKATATVTSAGDLDEVVTSKIRFDGKKDAPDDDIHFKRMNFGANVTAGYQLSNGLFVHANYNYAFTNLSPDKTESYKTSYFGIGIGYFFGGKNN